MHYVYHLYDHRGSLVYVGRSTDPARRLRILQRKHSAVFAIHVSKPMALEVAQRKEKREIARLKPLLNQRVSSSPGMYGYAHGEATRRQMAAAHTGTKAGAQHRAAISAGVSGKPKSAVHRARLAAALRGKKLPQSTRNKMRIAAARRRAAGLPVGGQCKSSYKERFTCSAQL